MMNWKEIIRDARTERDRMNQFLALAEMMAGEGSTSTEDRIAALRGNMGLGSSGVIPKRRGRPPGIKNGQVKRKPGRPFGSKNTPQEKRKPGRPPGTKNKPGSKTSPGRPKGKPGPKPGVKRAVKKTAKVSGRKPGRSSKIEAQTSVVAAAAE